MVTGNRKRVTGTWQPELLLSLQKKSVNKSCPKGQSYSVFMEREIEIVASNRKATYQYFILDKYKAGIELVGTEVKSAKKGQVNLSDAYCMFKNGELWVVNMHVSEYKQGGINNHTPKRRRRLLLTKRELKKWEVKTKERGLTMVPLEVFINERGYIKLTIALVKGKKAFNKKQSIKEKDMKRDMKRNLKY